MPAETAFRSARDLIAEVKSGHAAPSDIAQATLAHIDALEPKLNAFAHINADDVMAQARALDARIAKKEDVGPLAGLPVAIKELIAMRGLPTEFGSKVMAGNVFDFDAPSVGRIRDAGAVMLGKTTTSEFGCKGVGDNVATGITRNPWNLDTTPGGSSAGAAAIVAAGISPFAVGTDGGGSVRIPGSLAGLFAIKAHFGRVPIYPVSATHTLAHVGPMSRGVRDAALALGVMAGFDARDHTSALGPVPDFSAACERAPKGLRVIYSRTLGYARPDAGVVDVVDAAVTRLEQAGCHVEVADHLFDDPVEIWASEFYAGVATRLKDALGNRRGDLDPAVADLLDKARVQDLGGYYAKVFERYKFRDQVRDIFDTYDIIASPTLPVSAFGVGLNVPPGHEDRTTIDWVYYTYPFNLTGNPAVSINAGFDQKGLPVGLQLVGRPLAEESLFSVSAALEALSPDKDRRPDLS
ncbi:MAG: amidase family protein [Rhodospirillaceae bacterium]